jgi:hypothetical protein
MKDVWMQGINSENYPRAFSFVTKEDASVQEFLTSTRLSENFFLPMSHEAMTELRTLHAETADIQITMNTHDTWTYAWGSDKYSSRLYYQFCFRNLQPHITFKWIWKSKCTPKLKFFGWLVQSDRLNTRNMLRRRHYQINSSFECLMCDQHLEETIEHMLFHCTFSTACWDALDIHWQDKVTIPSIIHKDSYTDSSII